MGIILEIPVSLLNRMGEVLCYQAKQKKTLFSTTIENIIGNTLLLPSLETGPPPSGQLNAGVRKEEGLARRPC